MQAMDTSEPATRLNIALQALVAANGSREATQDVVVGVRMLLPSLLSAQSGDNRLISIWTALLDSAWSDAVFFDGNLLRFAPSMRDCDS